MEVEAERGRHKSGFLKPRIFLRHCLLLVATYTIVHLLIFPYIFEDFKHSTFYVPPQKRLSTTSEAKYQKASKRLRSEVAAYFEKLDHNQSAEFYHKINSNGHLDVLVLVIAGMGGDGAAGGEPEMSRGNRPEVRLRNLAAFDQQVKGHYLESHILAGGLSIRRGGLVGLAICVYGVEAASLEIGLQRRIEGSIPIWQASSPTKW